MSRLIKTQLSTPASGNGSPEAVSDPLYECSRVESGKRVAQLSTSSLSEAIRWGLSNIDRGAQIRQPGPQGSLLATSAWVTYDGIFIDAPPDETVENEAAKQHPSGTLIMAANCSDLDFVQKWAAHSPPTQRTKDRLSALLNEDNRHQDSPSEISASPALPKLSLARLQAIRSGGTLVEAPEKKPTGPQP